MVQKLAKDIMQTEVITLRAEDGVKEAAKILSENNISGAPVVDAQGQVIGIVTDTDLIMQDAKIHFPTYLHLLDGFIYLGSFKKFEENLKKAVGAKVEDVMTRDVLSVSETDSIEDVATIMVDKKVDRLPVLKSNKLLGIITKADIVRSISKK